ncbi:MAG: hypothetical protein ACE37H_15895 [Phycisphaeraceae bacterium]
MTVLEILKTKKASIRSAPLPIGAPNWDDIMDWLWEDVDAAAKANKPGFKTIRKLLTDGRFDR